MKLRQVSMPQTQSDEPNVAPLIDIVFILLIFFVVTTTFARDLGLDIERPQASTATPKSTQIVRVAVSRAGNLAVDGKATSPWRLEPEVRSRLERYTDKSVLLVADEGTDAKTLVEVMDACRTAGASQVSLAVDGKNL